MQVRKFRVGITRFPYGGNGSTSMECPDVGDWLVDTVLALKKDERVEEVLSERFSDTPITMTRNAAIAWAKAHGVDVLLMVDSDMAPDLYLGHDPQHAKPFVATSFDFLCKHFEKGPVAVVAPYCGPPQHPLGDGFENPYVFRWQNYHTGHLQERMKLEGYSRAEAAVMTGFSNVDAGATGLSMYDMRLFELLCHPYFDYEWEGDNGQCPHCRQFIPGPRTQKASTEDCFFFRNVALNGSIKLGYNPVFCNWDSWAGHWKPWCVGKPTVLTSDGVGRALRHAIEQDVKMATRVVEVRPPVQEMAKANGRWNGMYAGLAPSNGHAPERGRKQRILTVCHGGNFRSVALSYVLKWNHGKEALPIGLDVAEPETLAHMCQWADRIIVVETSMCDRVPAAFHDKLTVYDVGPDRWRNALDRELLDLFRVHAEADPLIQGRNAPDRESQQPQTDAAIAREQVEFWQGQLAQEMDDTPGPDDLGWKQKPETLKALEEIVREYCRARMPFDHKLVIAELGTWVGKSAMALIRAVPAEIADYIVETHDSFDGEGMPSITGDIWNQFQHNCGHLMGERDGLVPRLKARVWKTLVNSVSAYKLDILFIDAALPDDTIQEWIEEGVREGGLVVWTESSGVQWAERGHAAGLRWFTKDWKSDEKACAVEAEVAANE